jgi:peptide/nickel transport system substrate-binding protein
MSQIVTRRTAALGAAALGAVGLAGCRPRETGNHAEPQAVATPAGPPKRGGRIRVASTSSSIADTLDPAKGAFSTDYTRHNLLYSGLTQLDTHLMPQLALAEAIESADRITWTIRLRSGIEFHDGSTLTAQDVVYSLLRHKDPGLGSKVKTIADQIAEARAVGPRELEVRLTGPNADLPAILATSHFAIIKDGTTDFRTANGCGPFRLKTFKPGIRTVVSRSPNYWKSGRPYLDEIELIGIPDELSRVNALLSGDAQLVNAVDARSVRRVRATGKHQILETRSGLYTNLIMRQDGMPTSHPDFVLAMKHLLERELVKKALFRGYAVVGNDQPIPPGHPYYLEGLPQRTYDADKARFLLKRAGLLNVRLPVYASPVATGSVDMASILQEAAGQIGFRLAVNRVPSDGYWSKHWMRHPMTFGNTNPRPTADLIFSLFFKSDAAWNESGWKNPHFDQLLLAARGEADVARRKQMYADLQTMVHQGSGVAIPAFISLVDAFDARLKGVFPIPIGGLMGYSFGEHVWWDG